MFFTSSFVLKKHITWKIKWKLGVKQDYRTIAQNSPKLRHKGVLNYLLRQIWKIIRRTYALEFPFNTVTRMQSTAYYQTKDCTADTFWKCLERRGSSKNSKTPKKRFFLTLQPYSPEFQTSANTDDSKN